MAISISSLVNEVVAKYDRNRNGVIDMKHADETLRHETRLEPDPNPPYHRPYPYAQHPDPFYYRDRWVTEVYSMRDLMVAADTNGDGKATRAEIEAVARGFDKDGDGKLSSRGFWGWLTGKPKQDYDRFDDKYGERLVTRWNGLR